MEVFRAPIEELRRFAQTVVCLVEGEEPTAHGEVRLQVAQCGDAPPRTPPQGEALDEAAEGSAGREKGGVRQVEERWRNGGGESRCQAQVRGVAFLFF